MALSMNAALVDNASTWTKPSAGHSGHDNTAGDLAWVPDQTYYRRVLLTVSGDAGEVVSIVNWEIYGNDLPFVADASALTVQATGGDYTAATAPALVNDRVTRNIWARNATAEDGGAPYYADTGTPWVSVLRANGPPVVVELPAYYPWDTAGSDSTQFLVQAFLPRSFGNSALSAIVAVGNPDVAKVS